ncbi:MAG: response regulator [Paludibacter sp.]|nr:response regulator [Paludibacter sp.]
MRKVLLGILLTTMLCFGIYMISLSWKLGLNETRERSLTFAKTIELALNNDELKSLKGSIGDEKTPTYLKIKQTLVDMLKIHPDFRYIYFYTKKNDSLYSMVDSEPLDSKDYASPGRVYTDTATIVYKPFITGQTIVTKPITDKWGTWISILVPIKDKNTGKIYAVLGMDYPADKWTDEAIVNSIKTGIIVIAFLLLLIALYIIFINNKRLKLLNTERIKTIEKMTAFAAVMEQSDDHITVKDLNLRIVAANNILLKELGVKNLSEVQGKTDAEVFELPETMEPVKTYMDDERKAQKLNQGEFILREEEFISPIGKRKVVQTKKYPIYDKNNKLIFTGNISRDITELKESQLKLKIKEERLKEAQKIGKTGHWEYDLINNKLFWSEQTFCVYEKDPESFIPNFNDIMNLYHPDERKSVLNEFNACVKEKRDLKIETRIVTPSGLIKYAIQRAKLECNKDGEPYLLIGSVADITEQKMVEFELHKAIELAEAASVAKSDFLSNMSHEIRTPLNGVIGFTDLLLNTNLSKIQKEYLDNAIISANSLLGVISDILDFSKIEAGKLELEMIKTDIVQLIESASDIIKVHAAGKGVELLLNIQPDIPRYAVIDPIRLKQILVNLMSNAVKFTYKGEVELKISFKKINERSGNFTLEVRDTGIGVKDTDKIKLFKAFSQADTSTTRRYGGTGLGLIISNSLADKMGSRIQFESEYGVGSRFFFTIQSEYEYGKKIKAENLQHVKRVMVVDDNINNRIILEHTFKYWGIEIVSCESGRKAIDFLKKDTDFNLIIMDYHMPDLNGLDTIELIRSELDLSALTMQIILLHSSSDDAVIHEAARNLGIRYSLTKPIKSNELYYFLQNLNQEVLLNDKGEIDHDIHPVNKLKPLLNEINIMVAEDIKMNMLVIGNMLQNIVPNSKIHEAANGEEVLKMLESVLPDIILMDVQMPVMDGIESTRQIRKLNKPELNKLPIIALTAGVSKEERENCYKAGMNDFLSKPIDKNALYEMILKYLKLEKEYIVETLIVDESVQMHFNKEKLMRKIGNSCDLFQNLMDLSQIEYPNYFDKISTGIDENNLQLVKSTAHTLKGSAYNMEYVLLGNLASEIELKIDQPKELQRILKAILSEWKVITELLK